MRDAFAPICGCKTRQHRYIDRFKLLVVLYVGTVLKDTGIIKEHRCWQVEMSKASRKYRNHGSK